MDIVILDLDSQVRRLRNLERRTSCYVQQEFEERFLAGWAFHDLSIEGWVFRDDEIVRALEGKEGRSYLENQLLEKVRCFCQTVALVKARAQSQSPLSLDFIKDIHRHLNSEAIEGRGRYRKGSGETRVYRHEMIDPSTISYRLRRFVSSVEFDANKDHPINKACWMHRSLVDIFPFHSDNGIVARMVMNYWLLRHGYPPALITVHQRHDYFDTYLSSNGVFQGFIIGILQQVVEASFKALQDQSELVQASV